MDAYKLIDWLWVNNYIKLGEGEDIEDVKRGIAFYKEEIIDKGTEGQDRKSYTDNQDSSNYLYN